MKGRPLSPEVIAQLRSMWDDGLLSREIAARTGVNIHTISTLASRQGWSKRYFSRASPHPDEEEMRMLWEQPGGPSASEIGRRFQVSKSVVVGLAHRRSWKRRIPERQPVDSDGRPAGSLFARMDALNARMDAVLAEYNQVKVGGRDNNKLMLIDGGVD